VKFVWTHAIVTEEDLASERSGEQTPQRLQPEGMRDAHALAAARPPSLDLTGKPISSAIFTVRSSSIHSEVTWHRRTFALAAAFLLLDLGP